MCKNCENNKQEIEVSKEYLKVVKNLIVVANQLNKQVVKDVTDKLLVNALIPVLPDEDILTLSGTANSTLLCIEAIHNLIQELALPYELRKQGWVEGLKESNEQDVKEGIKPTTIGDVINNLNAENAQKMVEGIPSMLVVKDIDKLIKEQEEKETPKSK